MKDVIEGVFEGGGRCLEDVDGLIIQDVDDDLREVHQVINWGVSGVVVGAGYEFGGFGIVCITGGFWVGNKDFGRWYHMVIMVRRYLTETVG